MSKKQLLADFIERFLPDSVLPFFSGLFSNKLTVLAYHRVCDIPKDQYFFDYELISADCENFEYQVLYAKRYFNPISMAQLVDYIEGKAELPKRPLLFTFDDGFDDNFLAAYPILKKHKVPATLFISTDYIDTTKTIWFDKLVAFILNMQSGELRIKELNKCYQLDESQANRREVAFDILSAIKRVSNNVRHQILENIFKNSDVSLDAIDFEQSKMMTWAQIKEMNQSVISIGSHTGSHPILTMLTDEELSHELVDSRLKIEEHLEQSIDSISYPNGGKYDFSNKVLKQTKRSGYKVGFSYIGGINYLPLIDKYTIKRLHIEYYVTKSYFKSLLCLPFLFSDD